MVNIRNLIGILALFLTACGQPPADAPTTNSAELIERVASEFVDGYYAHYPEDVYEIGYPDSPMHRFGDHGEESEVAWDAQVDDWLATLDGIALDSVTDTNSALTYVFAREIMQSLVARRACRNELWNISPTWTGWPFFFAATFAVQPVATAEEHGLEV